MQDVLPMPGPHIHVCGAHSFALASGNTLQTKESIVNLYKKHEGYTISILEGNEKLTSSSYVMNKLRSAQEAIPNSSPLMHTIHSRNLRTGK